jgi:hypothetical protein
MIYPAVIHCITPPPSITCTKAIMFDRAVQHAGNGFNAAMRVPRPFSKCAGAVAKFVKQQERN